MSKVIKNSLLSLVIFTSSILLSLQVAAQINDEIEKSFTVTSESTFSLNNINGSVVITSWQENTIKVIANISAETQESYDDVTINMKQQGKNVSVQTEYKENAYRQNKQAARVNYQVWLPEDANLSDIELVNGDLSIENISGEIDAEVVNGSIKATQLSGNSEISAVNGSVNVSYKAQAGDVDSIEIETVNGRIELFIPPSINANVSADTMHGTIKTAFGLTAKKSTFSGYNLRGEIGSGGTKIDLDSINGSIKVLQSE
jgi:DUF4097 and DUF4098 domain-containing protein YvlB